MRVELAQTESQRAKSGKNGTYLKHFLMGAAGVGLGGLLAGSLTLPAFAAGSTDLAGGKKVHIALILQDYINPYWISMHKATAAEAKELGVDLTFQAGKEEGDTNSQITEIDNAIAAGDQGIIIRSNGPAVNSSLRQAEKAGIAVVGVDTVPTPADIVKMTYATDNRLAGQLIGRYARGRLDGKPAVIAMLDGIFTEVLSVNVDRNHGFLEGMGIPVGKPNVSGFEPKSGRYDNGKGGTYKIACELPTLGSATGGQKAMETCLAKNPNINVVYAVNEPSAQGAVRALQTANEHPIVVTIDGSCANLPYIKAGTIAATAGQFPGKMGVLALKAIYNHIEKGTGFTPTPGLTFYNTGTEVYTDHPVKGVPSVTSSQAKPLCWGT
ncbi:MAG: substrate-binding domain-containing protein [Acetobacteraceae bacterium]